MGGMLSRARFFLFSLSAMCMVCALSHLRTGDAHAWIDAWIVCRYVGRWHISTRGWNCWQCNVLYRRGHRRVSGMGGGWLGWTMYFASSLCLCLPVDMPLQRTSIIIKHVHTHTHSEKRAQRERRTIGLCCSVGTPTRRQPRLMHLFALPIP